MSRATPFALSTVDERKAPFALSTVDERKVPFALSTVDRPVVVARRNKVQFSLSLVDGRVTALDDKRRRQGLSHAQLCGLSKVHPSTWFYLRKGEQVPRADTLTRIEAALDGAVQQRAAVSTAGERLNVSIAALVCATEVLLQQAIGGDSALLAQINPKKGGVAVHALVQNRIRAIAVYLLAVEIGIANAEIARALAVTRQNVQQLRGVIEELREEREDGPVNMLFARVAGMLTGRG